MMGFFLLMGIIAFFLFVMYLEKKTTVRAKRTSSNLPCLPWPAPQKPAPPSIAVVAPKPELPPPAPRKKRGIQLEPKTALQPSLTKTPPVPAVPIEQSITEAGVVCLICGHTLKILKTHLQRSHQMNDVAYRAQFGLKDDYPMALSTIKSKQRTTP
ncbi:MAG: MucR family transcriptional regulator [Magnetococcus sp. DMHC-6]